MFSPMGKKKILLEQRLGGRRGSLSSVESLPDLAASDFEPSSSKSKKNRGSMKEVGDSIASTSNLEKALADTGITGVMMRKILESTVRYRPEKDAVILKAFQSKHIEYDKFRSYLYSSFWLGFEEDEFQAFLAYFDSQQDGIINGYDFMIAFTRLGAIRKSRVSLAVREKQELFLLQQKEDEERRLLELEKKNDLAADFSFTDEVKAVAIKKLNEAAFKFDPNHPACASPESFNVIAIKPAVFK